MEEEVGAGVTINPIAFLVITKENVKLMPVNHSSSIDKLLDYIPDIIEKTNNMMNRCIQNKKEETEKIISKMGKKEKTEKEKNENNKMSESSEKDKITERIEKTIKKPEPQTNEPEEVTYEYEYNETTNDDEM